VGQLPDPKFPRAKPIGNRKERRGLESSFHLCTSGNPLTFDEAQHLSIECLETIRELLDQPPHCGLLFAGTHELEAICRNGKSKN
jgi:hypothetical protein